MTDVTEAARVYDLDGTLVHLVADWQAADQEVRELIDASSASTETDGRTVWELLDAAEANGIGAEVDELIAEHEREAARISTRLPSADELEDLSIPVAVCSLNCEAACHIALERHGLTDYVDAVVGRDTVGYRKPHPEPLLAAVRALSVEPEAALFVGDSERDAVTAERAGTRFRYVDGGPSGV
ncbi:MAG TPA: HAD-IA family hydrolase [Halobacteriales archaeon]|nr:HAD-IA family hydrolase [Halobacteriales archaeon]